MRKKSAKSFNSFFWRIFGVNKRVFQPSDIFDIERDKTADRQRYESFLSDTNILPIEKNKFEMLELAIFQHVMYEASRKNENMTFYIQQLNLIICNYKMILKVPLGIKSKYLYNINVLAFNIALILEHMKYKKYNTHIFCKSLQSMSLEPYLDFAKDRCTKIDNIGLPESMSIQLETVIEKVSEKHKHKIKEKDVYTYRKDISYWRTKKELPKWIDMDILTDLSIRKNENAETIVYFLQLLISRGLLFLDNEYNLKKEFLNRFEDYKLVFKNIFDDNNCDSKLLRHQKEYKILNPYPYFLENNNFDDAINLMLKDLDSFFENEKHILPDGLDEKKLKSFVENKIYEKIKKLFNEKEYKKSLEELKKADIEESDILTGIEFLLEVKLKNKSRIKKLLKKLDTESCGGMLTICGGNYQSEQFIELIENVDDLDECLEITRHFVRKNYHIFSNYEVKESSIIFSS